MDQLDTRPNVEIGLLVNQAAQNAAFRLYQERRPENTQRAQKAALKVFAEFLQSISLGVGDLYSDPFEWMGITWGEIQAFQQWQIRKGYAMKTVNDRCSTVKVYLALANQAGIIPDGEVLRAQSIQSYTRKESIDMDAKRAKEGIPNRIGNKKQSATILTDEQVKQLCTPANGSAQAKRDALMCVFFFDHGMRVSEVEGLLVEDIDLEARQINFYRTKTGTTSKHNLRGRAWDRLIDYLKLHPTKSGPLILASNRNGELVEGKGMVARSINARMNLLGLALGIEKLSSHDGRHHGATKAGNDPLVSLAGLMAWGGWASPQNAARYINKGEADNDGVFLGIDG